MGKTKAIKKKKEKINEEKEKRKLNEKVEKEKNKK